MKKRTKKLTKAQRENLALDMLNRLCAPLVFESVYAFRDIVLTFDRERKAWSGKPETTFGVLMP